MVILTITNYFYMRYLLAMFAVVHARFFLELGQ